MRMSEIKIGMKVVPFKKTVKGFGNLSVSHQWAFAKGTGLLFLYVIKGSGPRGAVCCSSYKKAPATGDFFMPGDLKPYMESYFATVVHEIQLERARQDNKWGRGRSLSNWHWLAILMEEAGEVAKDMLQEHALASMHMELVQVAAVAVAWLEDIAQNGDYREEHGFKEG